MGIRLKIIASTLVILTLSATAGITLLHRQQLAESQAQERREAMNDMRRLLMALDYQLTEVDVVLGSWANYTSFYEYAANRDPVFFRDELNANALKAAHFDLLMLIDPSGRITDHSEIPLADGSTPLNSLLVERDPRIASSMSTVVARQTGCSFVQLDEQFIVFCFRPLLTTDGQGPSHGIVAIGRRVSPQMMDAIREQTTLQFRLVAMPLKDIAAASGAKLAIESRIGRGVVSIEEYADRLDLGFPIIGFIGKQIGVVHLDWQRNSLARVEASQRYLMQVVVLLIGLTGIAMVAVIDRAVVRRLRRMKHELGQIIGNEDWGGEIAVRGNDEIAELAAFTNEIMAVIRTQLIELRDRSLTDTLTGLPNRRRFDDRLELATAQCKRHGRDAALLLFDVDYFKRYNDTYGHPAGDAALMRVAQCLNDVARRPGDLPARLGGEEFALLLEETHLDGARSRAESVRALLSAAAVPHSGNPNGVMTISCGIAILRTDDTPATVYSRADAALYKAKEQGRNCAVDDSRIPHEAGHGDY